MKKLVAFAAVIAAVSFASCGNKSAESTEEVAETATVEEVVPAVEETAVEEVAPAEADSTVTATEAPATEAAPAE